MSRRESVVYGINAALAVAKHRPEAIRRVLYHLDRRFVLGPLLKATAHHRRPYREVPAEDLERAAKTMHHEGVVVVTEPLALASISTLVADRAETDPARGLYIALDSVQNPHNLGAIIRSAAWFGAAGVIFVAPERQNGLSAAALRVAQGGAEIIPCCGVSDMADALTMLKGAGVRIVGADQNGRPTMGGPASGPVCIVMGAENDGLSDAVRAVIDDCVAIPGTGAVESLNVAVAAGILLSQASQAGPRGAPSAHGARAGLRRN
ncbi:MAG: TrmH RNA methyltransferase [Bradymonadia bacterium]|jgi:TrmH RNA methyltransferase